MARIINVEKINKVKKAIPVIEKRLKIKIQINKNRLTIKGKELEEYRTEQILRAVDFGFLIDDALLLKSEDFSLKFLDIKEHTHRKNLKDVRSRVIGTRGKAKKTIEKLTGSHIVIDENTVGIIVDNDHLETTLQALESLIQGSKHGNVFKYLERQGKVIRKNYDDDLGLKEAVDDIELEDLG